MQLAVFGVWLTLQVGLMVHMSDDRFKKYIDPIYICEWAKQEV